MDRVKVTKNGKYKRFIMISIVMMAMSIICLFSIPNSITANKFFMVVWVTVFYPINDEV